MANAVAACRRACASASRTAAAPAWPTPWNMPRRSSRPDEVVEDKGVRVLIDPEGGAVPDRHRDGLQDRQAVRAIRVQQSESDLGLRLRRVGAAQAGRRGPCQAPDGRAHPWLPTISSEYERWEGRYRAPGTLFGKEPNCFLAACRTLPPRVRQRRSRIADGEGTQRHLAGGAGARRALDRTFRRPPQRKARALAKQRGGDRHASCTADVHALDYPDAAFDVVVEIFTQFSTPAERAMKWAGMRKALKPGGLADHPGLHAQATAIRHRRAEAGREPLHAARCSEAPSAISGRGNRRG